MKHNIPVVKTTLIFHCRLNFHNTLHFMIFIVAAKTFWYPMNIDVLDTIMCLFNKKKKGSFLLKKNTKNANISKIVMIIYIE